MAVPDYTKRVIWERHTPREQRAEMTDENGELLIVMVRTFKERSTYRPNQQTKPRYFIYTQRVGQPEVKQTEMKTFTLAVNAVEKMAEARGWTAAFAPEPPAEESAEVEESEREEVFA